MHGRASIIVCASLLALGFFFAPRDETRLSAASITQPARAWTNGLARIRWGRWDNGRNKLQLATDELDFLVTRAFHMWAGVRTANLDFKFESPENSSIRSCGQLLEDFVTPRDIKIIFDQYTRPAERLIPCVGGTPSDSGVTFEQRPIGSNLTPTYIIIDNEQITTREELFNLLVHEAGHSLGLEHTTLGLRDPYNRTFMFPIPHRINLHSDDEAWISALYPLQPEFDSDYGWIEGRLLDAADSSPISNVVVTAVRILGAIPTARPSRIHQYEAITRFEERFGGTFSIPVTRGRYHLRIDPLPATFPLARGSSASSGRRAVIRPQRLVQPNLRVLSVAGGQHLGVGDIRVTGVR